MGLKNLVPNQAAGDVNPDTTHAEAGKYTLNSPDDSLINKTKSEHFKYTLKAIISLKHWFVQMLLVCMLEIPEGIVGETEREARQDVLGKTWNWTK